MLSASNYVVSIVILQCISTQVITYHLIMRNSPATDNDTWNAAPWPWLPRTNDNMAICSNDDIIYLFGGRAEHQLVRYNISNGEMYDNGTNATYPYSMQGSATFYAQNNSICCIIEQSGHNIIRYDLKNNRYSEPIRIENYDGVNGGSCLASYKSMLFVAGGKNNKPLNTLQIYNMSGSLNEWTQGPSLHIARFAMACIVSPISGELYAIGGWDHGAPSTAVETILVDHIMYRKWQINNTLLYPTTASRVILFNNTIWVIGGSNKRQIQLINCTNGQVSLGAYLNYSAEGTGAIIVNKRMYAFGGANTKTWQYWDVPSPHGPKLKDSDFIWIVIVGLICAGICVCCMIYFWRCRKRSEQQRRLLTFSGMNQVQAK